MRGGLASLIRRGLACGVMGVIAVGMSGGEKMERIVADKGDSEARAWARMVEKGTAPEYKAADCPLTTEWGAQVNPGNVWSEYPRPAMVRKQWENLNGLWEYAIVKKNAPEPKEWEGRILVPFAVESALSGVGKTVGRENALWYKRSFRVPQAWKGNDVLLNFGAVDWESEIWVNGIKVGEHTGGYTSFSLDITQALRRDGENELVVRVWDPTDAGQQPAGKQRIRPEGIWYTSVTGIWQTVWIEPVGPERIERLRITPDVDRNQLVVGVTPTGKGNFRAEVAVLDGDKVVARGSSLGGVDVKVNMPEDVKLWSPENPALYDLVVTLYDDGKVADRVGSYAAMRKVGTRRGADGVVRMQLNGKDVYHFGPLDQGWWPDGLYTAPSYEAMIYDVDKTKDWGYNMIRKHVKVEPALWYAYCDKVGMLVWQDMPSGGTSPGWNNHSYWEGVKSVRTPESEAIYMKEWPEIMEELHNYPSINVWVPFNESWGQFNTEEVAELTKRLDPSRLVNPASGGNFYHCGDILDFHRYPDPEITIYDGQRVTVIGEYGGIGMVSDGHIWSPERNWGYVEYKTPAEVTDKYVEFARKLKALKDKGLSGAVYTQTTDVENEVNGIMTYDRKVVKMDEARIREANEALTK